MHTVYPWNTPFFTVPNYRAVIRLVYGQRRSSILLQSARDRVATGGETVTASRLWSAMSVKQGLIGSLGHHQKLTHCWQYVTRHRPTCKVS